MGEDIRANAWMLVRRGSLGLDRTRRAVRTKAGDMPRPTDLLGTRERSFDARAVVSHFEIAKSFQSKDLYHIKSTLGEGHLGGRVGPKQHPR